MGKFIFKSFHVCSAFLVLVAVSGSYLVGGVEVSVQNDLISTGDNVYLTCRYPVSPLGQVRWQKSIGYPPARWKTIPDGTSKYEIEDEDYQSELEIFNFQLADEGKYRCSVGLQFAEVDVMLTDLYMQVNDTSAAMYSAVDMWCFVLGNNISSNKQRSVNLTWSFGQNMSGLEYSRQFGTPLQELVSNSSGVFLHLVIRLTKPDQFGHYTCKASIGDVWMIKDQMVSVRCRDGCTAPAAKCVDGRCQCNPGYVPNPDPNKLPCLAGDPFTTTPVADDPAAYGNKPKVEITHSLISGLVGGIVGSICLIFLLVVGFICYWRRRKLKKKKRARAREENPDYQYEYHSEAIVLNELGAFNNPNYDPKPKPPAKESLKTHNSKRDKRDKFEISRESLQLGVDLGEGRFGKVIQARAANLKLGEKWTTVAVKTCRGIATDSEKQDLYQELEIMMQIPQHNNIIALLGCCSKVDPLYIVMEYAQRGSLLDYLRKCRPSSRFSRESKISRASRSSSFMLPRSKDLNIFALQVARGMDHLATHGIIHRDLATRNVLLGSDFTCKICDFGLARDVEGVDVYERTSKGPLPIRWMAPEALEDNCYTRKSDVWSYGILLWEIVTLGATPYPGQSALEVMRTVLTGGALPRPLHCQSEMYELMRLCWQREQEARPSFAQIAEHVEVQLDEEYIHLGDYEEQDYMFLDMDHQPMDERV